MTYALVIAVLVVRHEPWFDEAQAWLLARDSSLGELLTQRLRYEGHPALWYLLLFVPAKLGLPYASVQVIAGIAAVAGAYVLARRSPFPLPVKALLLFSFVIGYQYAVVARSYALVPLLLFLLAHLYPRKTERIGTFTVLLVLLANVSVHGLLIAGSIAAVHGLDLLRGWRTLDASTRRRNVLAGGGFAATVALVALQLLPPADLTAGSGWNLSPDRYLTIAPRFLNSAYTGRPLVTLIAVGLSAWWFWRTRTLLLWALPTLALATLAAVKYFNLWHDGLPFLVWVFALWVSWTRTPKPGRATGLLRPGLLVALALVLPVHLAWWAQTAAHDFANPYSGAEAAAEFLQETGLVEQEVWARSFHTIGLQPYFDRNIFANLHGGAPQAYWVWQAPSPLEDSLQRLQSAYPDVIVWGVKFPQDRLPYLVGYERTGVFRGQLFWKNRVMEPDSFVIYERTAGS